MARTTTKTYSTTDDLANGAKLSDSAAVRIVLTDGQTTFTVDTARTNDLAQQLRRAGQKGSKRGRKAAA